MKIPNLLLVVVHSKLLIVHKHCRISDHPGPSLRIWSLTLVVRGLGVILDITSRFESILTLLLREALIFLAGLLPLLSVVLKTHLLSAVFVHLNSVHVRFTAHFPHINPVAQAGIYDSGILNNIEISFLGLAVSFHVQCDKPQRFLVYHDEVQICTCNREHLTHFVLDRDSLYANLLK